jgi:hypothetical protein
MDLENLGKLYKLCPKIQILHVYCDEEHLQSLEFIPKFKELKSITFISHSNNKIKISPFTALLKNLKENKLEKISFFKFNEQDPKEALEFYKTLFEMNLDEFKGCFSHYNKEESIILSSFIESNSNLKNLSVNCKFFIFS